MKLIFYHSSFFLPQKQVKKLAQEEENDDEEEDEKNSAKIKLLKKQAEQRLQVLQMERLKADEDMEQVRKSFN